VIGGGIYLVTDSQLCGGPAGVLATVRAAVAGGASAVQLRDPLATTRELMRLGGALKRILDGTGVPLIINDRIDVALALDAEGAHIGQHDLDARSARRLLGPGRHLGLSVSSLAELDDTLALPVGTIDLLGVGPIRATARKPDASPPVGIAGLGEICAAADVPCVAIGGLVMGDARAVRHAGASGMAVISAICGTPDPEQAARDLCAAWSAA
jgi:thiamine-phosphate pyrophosphorylase